MPQSTSANKDRSHSDATASGPTFERIHRSDSAGKADLPLQFVAADGTKMTFTATLRLDTPNEVDYYRHGGILQFVLRQMTA